MLLITNCLCILTCLFSIESRRLPIEKRSGFCGVQDNDDDIIRIIPRQRQRPQRKEQTIELGVYYEPYLRQKFLSDTELETYVKTLLSGAQAVLNYPTMRTKIKLVVNKFELVPSHHLFTVYNASTYLESFCQWQWKTFGTNKNYDLGVLLVRTSLRFWRRTIDGGEFEVIEGMARLNGVCPPQKLQDSCLIANVSYLDAMWVLAHEIMHTLGVQHTKHCGGGPQGQGVYGVMHKSGIGHFEWTDCTNDQLEEILDQEYRTTCLLERAGTPLRGWDLNRRPFHSLTRDAQCASNFGQKYSAHDYYNDNCEFLICSYDLVQTIQNGSPLEDSKCGKPDTGYGMCDKGECVIG